MTYAVELLSRVVKVVKMSTEVTTVDYATMAKINFSQKCHSSFHKQSGATKRKVLLSVCKGT